MARVVYIFLRKCTASHVVEDFTTAFGRAPTEDLASPVIETYLTEGFDAFALEYFQRKSREDALTAR